ncbi:MAG: ribonuclease R [candidate division Zixibacteria bacterium]|nr:ribonuclease R [candidate division Zixibacteria bacterium]
MPLTDRQVLEFIKAQSDRPMKLKELARALEVSAEEYPALRRAVKQMIDAGDLVMLKRNRIGVAEKMNLLVGKISIARTGTGFVSREGQDEDIVIPSSELQTSLDGDEVVVRLTAIREGRQYGTVIRVAKRVARNIVGTFRISRSWRFVVPDNPKIHRDIYIAPDQTQNAKEGEKVVAVLTVWDDPYQNPEGKIIERLGPPHAPGVDMLAVIRSFNFNDKFSADVLSEAEQVAARLDDGESHGKRLDLTRECIYTIDPVDAKDHDDAVAVEKTSEGYRLGVHIADVSFYVDEGGALDQEALLRGNSVYLPGTVIPMLPEILSSDTCSLRPHRNRLTHSVFIDFDRTGKPIKWEIKDTIISSKAKLTYEQVQAFFDGKDAASIPKAVSENLQVARQLAQILSQRRFSEGSLDFDLPESSIILNDQGEVVELGNRVRLESHRLVEEFMLAANRAVALEVFRLGQPFLYRVHDRPDHEKVQAFSYMMGRLGQKFPVSPNLKPVHFARFLKSVEKVPEADFINELMLRSMQKAVYQRENIGHFGLAFTHYTHFTSPIRRYPDLVVHRLLRKLKKGTYPHAFAKRAADVIDMVGHHCSETERTAEQAERLAVKIKQAAFMAKHVGEEYDGVVSGVTPFGFFVRLLGLGAEGMVRMSTVDDDYYIYDEKHYQISGRRRGRSFRLGDSIRVGVLKVDTVKSEIDLYPAEKAGTKKATDKPLPKPGGATRKKNHPAMKKRRHGRKT